jgi:hypothetical protein
MAGSGSTHVFQERHAQWRDLPIATLNDIYGPCEMDISKRNRNETPVENVFGNGLARKDGYSYFCFDALTHGFAASHFSDNVE